MGENGKPLRVQFHYVDLAGFMRSVDIPYDDYEKAVDSGHSFPAALDGSSVYGFRSIEDSDLLLKPLKYSFSKIPWLPEYARVLATVYEPEGSRFSRDPRLAAERAVEVAAEQGYKVLVGAEVEFFIFESMKVSVDRPQGGMGYSISSIEYPGSEKMASMVKGSYHYPDPMDSTAKFRIEVDRAMRSLGYRIKTTHHEVAVSQLETGLEASDPPRLGDAIVTLKWASRNIALRMGLVASFHPKPLYGDNGSGMHLHMSLWSEKGENMFAPIDGTLPELARYFVGGILSHARSLAAIVAPTTNSYRRLVPGYEAPVYATWGFRNRSAMVRIPAGRGSRARIEFRTPDPSSNPYLALAATIMAGLDGVKKKIDPGDPADYNVYKLSPSDLKRLNIEVLPRSLDEALDELESDNEYLRPAFTKEMLEAYIEVKREEAEKVRMMPHPYEIYYYYNL